MGPICANGLLHAAADLLGPAVTDLGAGVRGRRVLVTGAGVVGLLTGLFAHALGAAEVAVADPTADRRAAAAGLGLQPGDSAGVDVGTWAKQRWRHSAGDRGADVVFQCRGQAAALHDALRALRPQGTLIDLAFYPAGSEELRLGEEFHHNGLRLVCAQIGRVPRGLQHLWDRERLSAETVALTPERGDDVRAHLVTDLVPLRDAPDLFAGLLARRRQVLQAVLPGPAGGGRPPLVHPRPDPRPPVRAPSPRRGRAPAGTAPGSCRPSPPVSTPQPTRGRRRRRAHPPRTGPRPGRPRRPRGSR